MVDVFNQSRADSIRESQTPKDDAMEKMGQAFRGAAKVPEGPASYWVNYGVRNGFIPNTPEAKDRYAYNLGRAFFFAKTDAGEKFAEDLNPQELAEKMGVSQKEASQLISGLVGAEVIKSRREIELRKRAARY